MIESQTTFPGSPACKGGEIHPRCAKMEWGRLAVPLRRSIVWAFLPLALLSGFSQAGEVSREIRFHEKGFIACPGEGYIILIDIRGEEHKIDVRKGDRFAISDSSEYRGPRQYSTENGERIYKRVRITGCYYHWFYISDACSRSWIENEINKMMRRGQ